jgi:hypothetical protein
VCLISADRIRWIADKLPSSWNDEAWDLLAVADFFDDRGIKPGLKPVTGSAAIAIPTGEGGE